MKIISNTTQLPSYAIRRAIVWVCSLLEFSSRDIRGVRLRNLRIRWNGKSIGWSGRATGSMYLRCRIGRDGDTSEQYQWLIECLGHEIKHLRDFANRRPHSKMERTANEAGRYVLAKFIKEQKDLIEKWEIPPARRSVKPKLTVAQINERKARQALAKWTAELQKRERGVKAARKKMREYTRRVARYERVAAKRANP